MDDAQSSPMAASSRALYLGIPMTLELPWPMGPLVNYF
jgi:hypothetical protein